MLLDMAASTWPDRCALVEHSSKIKRITYSEIARTAAGGARIAVGAGHDAIIYIGVNGLALPTALFAANNGGIPFVPLNYRLSDDNLRELLSRFDNPLIIMDDPGRLPELSQVMTPSQWLSRAAESPPSEERETDPDSIAVLLYTSGTTAAPKAAVLRNRHLVSYVLETVEFGSGADGQASLVSVPPYHVAAVANLLSNLYAGRRVVYLDRFDPETWLDMADSEAVTHAMVVPTMLARICDYLRDHDQQAPPIRSLSYGGAPMPGSIIQDAVRRFATTGFVNAYGLTETASTIALLGPDDHRSAIESTDPAVRARLGSAGRAVPGVEIGIFRESGTRCEPDERGELRVRGPQVSGEYLGTSSALDDDGWFKTRDQAYLDDEGYLFIEGRMDDTIIRGGENVAPAEIEEVIIAHPAVADAGVTGVADDEWGQRIVAHVVTSPGSEVGSDEVREWVRSRLRSSKTPDEVIMRAELPRTDTGKLIRRSL